MSVSVMHPIGRLDRWPSRTASAVVPACFIRYVAAATWSYWSTVALTTAVVMAASWRLRVLAAVVVIGTPPAPIGLGYGPDHARGRRRVQVVARDPARELHARLQAEFGEDVRHVCLDRRHRDEQGRRDRRVGQPVGHQPCHLQLAGGQLEGVWGDGYRPDGPRRGDRVAPRGGCDLIPAERVGSRGSDLVDEVFAPVDPWLGAD